MNFVVVSSVGIKRIVCNGMHKISNEFEHWSDRTNGGSYVPFIVKMACKYSTGHVFSLSILIFLRVMSLTKCRSSSKLGHVGSKIGH